MQGRQGSSIVGLTFHEDTENISQGGSCGSKGTDGEEEGADGVSCFVLRLQRKKALRAWESGTFQGKI